MRKSNNKSTRTKKPLLWRLLKRYLLNCSVHGVRYLVEDGRHWTERFFWLICCGLSWWGCGLIICSVLTEYNNRRVATTVDTNYLGWKEPHLPAVHVCTDQTLDARNYFIKTWGKKFNINKLSNYVSMGYDDRLTEPKDAEHLDEFTALLRPRCEELFEKCTWMDVEIDCCEVFFPVWTSMGHCLSLNSIYGRRSSDGEKNASVTDSRKGGVRLYGNHRSSNRATFRFYIRNSAYWKYIAKHIAVYFLDKMDLPMNTNRDKQLPNKWKSSSTEVEVGQVPTHNEKGVKSVPIEKRNCRFVNEIDSDHIYDSYGTDACVTEMYAKRMMEYCGCVSHLYPRLAGMRTCNLTELECVFDSTDRITDPRNQSCYASCEETTYSFFPSIHKMSGGSPDITITLLAGPTLRYRRYVIHNKIDLVVAMGSALGLFVGASILSIVEIPYWFLVRGIGMDREEDRELLANGDGSNVKDD